MTRMETYDNSSAGECVVAGWGSRGPLDDVSDFLMKVTAPILSDEECSKIFEKVNITIVDSMICAGDKTGGKGPFLVSSSTHVVYNDTQSLVIRIFTS